VDDTGHRIAQVRAAALALPEVSERPSHGAPTFFVREKRTFLSIFPDGHHDDDFAHLWCAAEPGAQPALIASDPDRFFRPPYVGHRGWIGVRLDRAYDDGELDELAYDAYRQVAPVTLVRRLDDREPGA